MVSNSTEIEELFNQYCKIGEGNEEKKKVFLEELEMDKIMAIRELLLYGFLQEYKKSKNDDTNSDDMFDENILENIILCSDIIYSRNGGIH